ncbi:MAG: YggS family pyridoxal phosphate-dependent enzyme [Gammaproteobacteria bacterium]
MKNIEQNLSALRQHIAASASKYGRPPESVHIIAVSKRQPAAAIRAAMAAGQRDFGENYLQEAIPKIETLPADLTWHFIGPLQSNKTRTVAEHFDWLHSLDRAKLARRLQEQRPDALPALNVCLQVNISAETSKSGVDLAELPNLAAAVAALPRLRLRGLMALPAPASDFEQQRRPFRALREAFDSLNKVGFGLDTLSMGTSTDMAAAIAEGATHVRIGTAIFGRRDPETPGKPDIHQGNHAGPATDC